MTGSYKKHCCETLSPSQAFFSRVKCGYVCLSGWGRRGGRGAAGCEGCDRGVLDEDICCGVWQGGAV